MNTLHMYHWHDIKMLKSHLKLMGASDSLVIYGSLTNKEYQSIEQCLEHVSNQWYVVNHPNSPNINPSNNYIISENTWLELIIEHKNTLTWK